jgi:hydrogenase expression/formation protein HypE
MMKKRLSELTCPMPEFEFEKISLGHGSGGQLTNQLLQETVFKLIQNPLINQQHDGAIFKADGNMAFSTDSFVVSPIFFPGGNIGDLAINGTMNDLAMCGAVPKYMSLALILEEGLPIRQLWAVLDSIAKIANTYGVVLATGDTKVVERGKGDKMFINTTGIGKVMDNAAIGVERICDGDKIIVSGPIATHGMAVQSVREGLEFETTLQSDTQYIGDVVTDLIERFGEGVRFLRDPTRGGVATVLNEITQKAGISIELEEARIPVLPQARGACEMLGLDPLYVANEGLFVAVIADELAEDAIGLITSHPKCAQAALIGTVGSDYPKKVIVKSAIGGKRVVPMMIGEQLPRIC